MGIMVTASNVLCGIVALYGLPLTNGGPAWATWSYVAVGSMSVIVSLCLAELASAYPTTAGIHHWVYQLGSTHQRAFLTWLTGWLTLASSVNQRNKKMRRSDHAGEGLDLLTGSMVVGEPLGCLCILSGVLFFIDLGSSPIVGS